MDYKNYIFISILLMLSRNSFSESLAIQNYDNHPALQLALSYDGETNGCNIEQADRSLAEKYYLEYLKDVNESFQRARVYSQLGALFATSYNPDKGEKPDLNKARYYFEKVLENEPHRIDNVTIRARTMLASIPMVRIERIRKRIDLYEWIIKVGEQDIKNNWLPLTPDNTEPTKLQLKGNHMRGEIQCLETNIMSGIKHLDRSDKETFLNEIVHRFPNTNLGEMAVELAQKENIDLSEDSSEQMSELKEPKEIPLAAAKQSAVQSPVIFWKKPFFYISAAAIGLAVIVLLILFRKKLI